MKKILDKWYLSVFIIPIVLTYLTNYVGLPLIFANWEYSIIASITILIGILLYEIITLKRELVDKPGKVTHLRRMKLTRVNELPRFDLSLG